MVNKNSIKSYKEYNTAVSPGVTLVLATTPTDYYKTIVEVISKEIADAPVLNGRNKYSILYL